MIIVKDTCPGCSGDYEFAPVEVAIYKDDPDYLKRLMALQQADRDPRELYGYILSRCPACKADVFIHFNMHLPRYVALVEQHFPGHFERGAEVDDVVLFNRMQGNLRDYVVDSSLTADKLSDPARDDL